MVRNFIQFRVGDGTNNNLWLDWWHPDDTLYLRYAHRLVYDAGSKVEARLASVLKSKEWYWPAARSDEMISVQSKFVWLRLEKMIDLFG